MALRKFSGGNVVPLPGAATRKVQQPWTKGGEKRDPQSARHNAPSFPTSSQVSGRPKSGPRYWLRSSRHLR